MIGHIARGKYSGDAGQGRLACQSGSHLYITALHIQLPAEDIGIRFMSYGDEHPGDVELCRGFTPRRLQAQAGNPRGVTQHFLKGPVPVQNHFSFFSPGEQSIL